jgi:hypothetical protein
LLSFPHQNNWGFLPETLRERNLQFFLKKLTTKY